MVEKKMAQVAIEYMILTAFIMVAVGIIFAFSFINYTQSIKVAKTGEALSKMANAVDEIYTKGEGNSRFIHIAFPENMTGMSIVHKCIDESTANQGTLLECGVGCSQVDYDCVEFSAISITVNLIAGESTLLRETKAKIWDKLEDFLTAEESAGSTYTVKVSWTGDGEKIQLKKV